MIPNKIIERGDIYFARLNPAIGSEQRGTRPVVVVQNNLANKTSPTILVAPITSNINKNIYLPTHIQIKNIAYIKENAIILLEQIRVLDRSRIYSYLSKLDDKTMDLVEKGIIHTFGIDERRNNEKVFSLCDKNKSK